LVIQWEHAKHSKSRFQWEEFQEPGTRRAASLGGMARTRLPKMTGWHPCKMAKNNAECGFQTEASAVRCFGTPHSGRQIGSAAVLDKWPAGPKPRRVSSWTACSRIPSFPLLKNGCSTSQNYLYHITTRRWLSHCSIDSRFWKKCLRQMDYTAINSRRLRWQRP
jgi:hypothetical protein